MSFDTGDSTLGFDHNCDHDDDLVTVYSDPIAEAAPFVDCAVLVEYSEDGISIYMTDIDDDCASQILARALDHMQGA